jgi:threonine dehydratase
VLAGLLGLVAETGANIVGVEHHREGTGVRIGEVDVILQVETRGLPHIAELTQTLTENGYRVEPF